MRSLSEKLGKKIKWMESGRLSEIYSQGVQLAFLSRKPNLEQACSWVTCKDFLHDAVRGNLHGRTEAIYGFNYGPKNPRIDSKRTLLLFRDGSKSSPLAKAAFFNSARNIEAVLRTADRKLGLRPSRVMPVPSANFACVIVSGDPRWMLAPPLISLYTLLIRVGFFISGNDISPEILDTLKVFKDGKYSQPGHSGSNDASYVRSAYPGIERVMERGVSIFGADQKSNYPTSVDIGSFHNHYGIVSFSGKMSSIASQKPEWFK